MSREKKDTKHIEWGGLGIQTKVYCQSDSVFWPCECRKARIPSIENGKKERQWNRHKIREFIFEYIKVEKPLNK